MDRLQIIFDRQRDQTKDFHGIQAKNGLLFASPPADPLTREGALQLHLDLHWINLEIFEVLQAESQHHAFEEMADVFHFAAEFCIVAGFSHELIDAGSGNIDRLDLIFRGRADIEDMFRATMQLADLLKNKPWKQTVRLDFDRIRFEWYCRNLLMTLGAFCHRCGAYPEDIFDAYLAKEKVNHRRREDGV